MQNSFKFDMSAKEPDKSNSTEFAPSTLQNWFGKNEYVSQFHQHLNFRAIFLQIMKGMDSSESSNYYWPDGMWKRSAAKS